MKLSELKPGDEVVLTLKITEDESYLCICTSSQLGPGEIGTEWIERLLSNGANIEVVVNRREALEL